MPIETAAAKKLGKEACLSRKSPRLFWDRDTEGIAVRTHRQSSSGSGNAPPSSLKGNCLLVTNTVEDGENQLDLMSQSLLSVLPSLTLLKIILYSYT